MNTRGLFQHYFSMHAVQRTATLTGVTHCRIQAINVTGTARKTAPFTRTNRTTGTSGTPELSGSLLLASNNFYREFTDNPAITTAALALRGQIAQFVAATTRPQPIATVDGATAAYSV